MSPDARIGAVTPRLLASVRETSTCVSFLTGPRTDIFWLPFVPTTSTFSSQANCPGWLNIFFTVRSEEHTSELQSRFDLVCRLLLEKKKNITFKSTIDL